MYRVVLRHLYGQLLVSAFVTMSFTVTAVCGLNDPERIVFPVDTSNCTIAFTLPAISSLQFHHIFFSRFSDPNKEGL